MFNPCKNISNTVSPTIGLVSLLFFLINSACYLIILATPIYSWASTFNKSLVSITTFPPKATVEINLADGSKRKKRSPWRLRIPAGEIIVNASLAGYRSESQNIILNDKQHEIHFCLDPHDQAVNCRAVFKTGLRPKQVVFSKDNKELWVTLLKDSPAVQIFDVAFTKLIDSISLGGERATEIIFNAKGERAYVSQMRTASVYEIDTATRTVLRRFVTSGKWSKGMALSPDESKLYVSNWITSDISEFDLATGEKTHSWSVAATPRGLFTVPSGQKLLIASFGAGLIEALDLQSQARETIFNSEGAMRHFAYDKQQQLLYVSDMKNNAIYRAKLPDGKWEFFVRTESHPNTIKLTPDGKILAISNRGVNGPKWPGPGATWGAIMLIDTSNGKILDVIVGGNQCTGLDISSDGKTLAFSDFNDDRIHLIDLPSYEELLKYNGGRLKSYAKDLKKVTTFNKISR